MRSALFEAIDRSIELNRQLRAKLNEAKKILITTEANITTKNSRNNINFTNGNFHYDQSTGVIK